MARFPGRRGFRGPLPDCGPTGSRCGRCRLAREPARFPRLPTRGLRFWVRWGERSCGLGGSEAVFLACQQASNVGKMLENDEQGDDGLDGYEECRTGSGDHEIREDREAGSSDDRSQLGNMCPKTAQRAASASTLRWGTEGSRGEATKAPSSTAAAPLAASRTKVAAPRPFPPERNTLVAPMLPLPTVRMSSWRKRRTRR